MPKLDPLDPDMLKEAVINMKAANLYACLQKKSDLKTQYLSGEKNIKNLFKIIQTLKHKDYFYQIFTDLEIQKKLTLLSNILVESVVEEQKNMKKRLGRLSSEDALLVSQRIETLKDISWCLSRDILGNIPAIKEFMSGCLHTSATVKLYQELNTVFNSLDRLEVRGRDSNGISIMLILTPQDFIAFQEKLEVSNCIDQFKDRLIKKVLLNKSISLKNTTLVFTYKIAAEIGSLGDNVNFLRRQIKDDLIFQMAPANQYTILAHTRWASVGAINAANCHPLDNVNHKECQGIIHVCLNGDIDNYTTLKAALDDQEMQASEEITTDTKVIPLQIEMYLRKGHDISEAFRLAVNDFSGSHAISMHTDMAPGKIFLAQRGSGQAIFVGLAEDHYLVSSEVYGFVEETHTYLKLEGETQGQIFILDGESSGLDGITALYYNGTVVTLTEANILKTELNSRDIDRQDYPHYFLKEISQSPFSVENTLLNRWEITPEQQYQIKLSKAEFPASLSYAWEGPVLKNTIQRIFFVGQGTAGIAAQVCADLFRYYLDEPFLQIDALKSSELSGFKLDQGGCNSGFEDTLVVAITQSGTTTDTNRTIDMVRAKKAHTLAIVNRRDSDITFKVDGVIYTSCGRDIEMSVASTKAFYSQIIAGAVLGLFMAQIKGRDPDFINSEIKKLLAIPAQMEKVLTLKDQIKNSAQRLATAKTYWAAVGSGPNKSSADEIRIKLSELCYKTISSDFVEDKKHIDLSSEPLIMVCAAGTRETVIGDIVKDTAIFNAHKSTVIVIADENEYRFTPYAQDVFHVPAISEHLAPLLNTLAGHLWGYYAALVINEDSVFLNEFREEICQSIDQYAVNATDVYELVLEKSFQEKIVHFYQRFRARRKPISPDLILLLKYLAGKLPAADFEIDFNCKGTASNMLEALLKCLGDAINISSRPVDAIKHQAKTVTVGTSRLSKDAEGLIFESLKNLKINLARLTPINISVLKKLQKITSKILGTVLYKIEGLNLLGEPTLQTTITILSRHGTSAQIPSRIETDQTLKGIKKIIVRRGNVYIGIGRKDERSILVIPILSDDPVQPNLISNLLLLNISFKEIVPLADKIKALGGKFEHIQNIVQEKLNTWDDQYLEFVPIPELFGRSAEKIGEFILTKIAEQKE